MNKPRLSTKWSRPRKTKSLLVDKIDDLLDEIDSVLEENAEEFVKNYVQKGGGVSGTVLPIEAPLPGSSFTELLRSLELAPQWTLPAAGMRQQNFLRRRPPLSWRCGSTVVW